VPVRDLVLGATAERVAPPNDLVGRLKGKSSLGRLGLLIHSTAGFVDRLGRYLTLERSTSRTFDPGADTPGYKVSVAIAQTAARTPTSIMMMLLRVGAFDSSPALA